jgi:hypothetical protein
VFHLHDYELVVYAQKRSRRMYTKLM